MDRNGPIGFFDSGLGGISILRGTRRLLPAEDYLYYGDSFHAPYGVRSAEEVQMLSRAITEHLLERGAKAIVIACNTATSAAQAALQEAYPDIPVIGIEPAIAEGVRLFPNGHVGALATPGTLKGKRFLENKARLEGDCRITAIPAYKLAFLYIFQEILQSRNSFSCCAIEVNLI